MMKNRKAVFLDYTGTMVREDGEYTKMLISFFMKNSDLNSPDEAVALVWKMVKQYEMESYRDDFITEDEIVDKIIRECANQYHLHGDFEELHRIWQKSWVYAPLYEDVKAFFEQCPYPIYVITNDGKKYIEESMRDKGLSPAGIISAEQVRAYKPHKEIFEAALEAANCSAEEVIHVGDSIQSDIAGAKNAGITGILLDRQQEKEYPDIMTAKNLQEVLEKITDTIWFQNKI